MKATVDENCIGCEQCVEVCPEVFVMNDGGMAEVKVDPVPPDAEDSCKEAAEVCPVEAIHVEE